MSMDALRPDPAHAAQRAPAPASQKTARPEDVHHAPIAAVSVSDTAATPDVPDLPIPTQAHPPEVARMTPEVIALLLVAIILSNIGEVLLKIGVDKVGAITADPQTLLRALFQWQVIAGFTLLFGGSLFWLAVLSRANLSVAYPVLAIGYVLVALFAYFFLKEPMSLTRWLGIGAIMVGVILVQYKV